MWSYNFKELYHYGVPGMRWGVRRSSRELSAASNDRRKKELGAAKNIAKESSNAFREGANAMRSMGGNRPSKKVKKELASMSDQELRARINRMQMEQQYSSMKPSRVSRGASFAANTLSVAGSVAAIGGSIAGIMLAMKQLKGN